MSIITVTTFTSDTETVTRTKLNGLVANLLNEFNGGIDNANINGTAAIAASKIDFTTASAIGSVSASSGAFTTLTTSGATTLNGDVTLGNASGDALTFHPNAWTLTNNVTITGTWTDLGTVTTVDINGGSIDGTPVGASSANTGAFTTLTGTVLTASTSLALATGATVTGINDTDTMSDASATTLATSESIKAYVDAASHPSTILCWCLQSDNANLVYDATATTATTTKAYSFIHTTGTPSNYTTIKTLKWKAHAGISNVTFICKIWGSGGSQSGKLQVTINGNSQNVTNSSGATPAWTSESSAIDVSGLTPGTIYDVTIALGNTYTGGVWNSWFSDLIMFGT